MTAIWSVAVVVLAVIALVVIVVGFHEFGHFTFGKLFGIRVDEFSIGFGKKLVSKRRGETEYAIRLIPLGGFVRMAGMLNHPSEADAGDRNFYRASIPKRIITLLAGIVFNIILAGVIYSIAFMLPSQSTVLPGGPAAQAGLRSGDSLLTIDGHPISHATLASVSNDVHTALNDSTGNKTQITYRTSDGTVKAATISPRLGVANGVIRPDPCAGSVLPLGDSLITAIDGKPAPAGDPVQLVKSAHTVDGVADGPPCNGQIFSGRTVPGHVTDWKTPGGVSASWRVGMGLDIGGMPLGTAIANGWGQVPQFFTDEYRGIKELFTDPAMGGPLGANGFEGPIGIGAASVTATQSGLQTYLEFMALISLNLGFVNLVPIPFLDGGKALLVAIEGLRRRRMDPRRELALYATGAAFLVIFALYVTIGDLKRLFH